MKDKTKRSLESVLKACEVERFLKRELPAPLKPLLRKLNVHAERLRQLRQEEILYEREGRRQVQGMQGAAGKDLRRKRDLLREDYLLPLGRAGRKVLKFAPGAEHAFEVPPKRSTAQEVVASARAMAKASRTRWRLFMDIGFPKDGVAKMMAAAKELDQMASRGTWARKERTGRLRDLERELRSARAIMDVMDAMITSLGRTDRDLLFQWRHAKRIPKKLGRPRKTVKKTAAPEGSAEA